MKAFVSMRARAGRRLLSLVLSLAALSGTRAGFAQETAHEKKENAPEKKKTAADAADADAAGDEGADEKTKAKSTGVLADFPESKPGAPASAAADAAPAPKEPAPPPQADTSGASTQADDQSEHRNGFVRSRRANTLEWSGELDLDPGYAKYTFDNTTIPEEKYYDLRGRFVIGPTVSYRFNGDWFLKARGEAVLWARETINVYQINADDVFAQVGLRGVWDFKVGRFQTWRVYHKGQGFDLYTLEDNGACQAGGCDPGVPGQFGPHTYEVSDIYYREQAGHYALHVYPTPWWGIEGAGVAGNTPGQNVLGTRWATLIHFPFVRGSFAYEIRDQHASKKSNVTNPDGSVSECPNCGGAEEWHGFGGGVELTVAPIELGFNMAKRRHKQWNFTNGVQTLDENTTSIGGYIEVDPGTPAFQRALILGFGINRTENLDQVQNFRQHYQGAAYIVYPLGFNDASVKLVLSEAKLYNEKSPTDDTMPAIGTYSHMYAARVRLAYPF